VALYDGGKDARHKHDAGRLGRVVELPANHEMIKKLNSCKFQMTSSISNRNKHPCLGELRENVVRIALGAERGVELRKGTLAACGTAVVLLQS
jgi:hypothetical protein